MLMRVGGGEKKGGGSDLRSRVGGLELWPLPAHFLGMESACAALDTQEKLKVSFAATDV